MKSRRPVKSARSVPLANAKSSSLVRRNLDATGSTLVSAERVRAYIRTRFNPIRSLTPELLAQHLDSFKIGFLKQAALIWEDIEERDDTLKSVAPKRKKAVARNGFEIVTVDTAGDESRAAEAQRHKNVLQDFWDNITVTDVLNQNQVGELPLLIRQMMDALAKKFAVHEIVWQPSGERLTAEFRFAPLWFFENTTGKLRFLPSDSALYGEDLEDGRWLVTVADGLMYACSVAYIYKNLSLKDWVIYSERHGMPGIHGKTSAAKDSTEWDDMVEAVENFAADWSIVTNEGASIDKVDLSTGGALPYPPLVDRMSRAMAAMWRGADLSTMSAGPGSGQGASLQGSEMDLLEIDDAAMISETLSRQIDRRVIEYHFGAGVKPLAYIRIKTSVKQNVERDIKVDSFLRDSGAPIAVKTLLERYDRAVPDKDAALLTPPAKTPSLDGLPNQRSIPPVPRRDLPADSGPNAALLSTSVASVASAFGADLKPIRDRLERIMNIEDPEFRNNALINLRNDLPRILAEINKDPSAARAIEDTLAAAFLNGLTRRKEVA